MVEITDRMQVFAPKPALFHGNLETLAPQNRPQPSTTTPVQVLDANKTAKTQLVFSLQSDTGSGRAFANVPYALFRDGAKLKDGITDDLGQIAVEHDGGAADYHVELLNGHRYALAAIPQLAPAGAPAHREQHLSNAGARAIEGSADSREHQ
jgi:type VI secretion system secreted protein VgrG